MKVKFCWLCGRKLRGNHFTTRTVDEHERVLHKACAQLVDEDNQEQMDRMSGSF